MMITKHLQLTALLMSTLLIATYVATASEEPPLEPGVIEGYKDIRLGGSWAKLKDTRSFLETRVPTEYALEGVERMEISGSTVSFTLVVKINSDSIEGVSLQAMSGDVWLQDGHERQLSQADLLALQDELAQVIVNKYSEAKYSHSTSSLTRPGTKHLLSRKRKAPTTVGTINTDLFIGENGNAIEISTKVADESVATKSGLVDMGDGGIVLSTWGTLTLKYYHRPGIANAEDSL